MLLEGPEEGYVEPMGRIFPVELIDFYVRSLAFDLRIENSEAARATLDVLVQAAVAGHA